MQLADPVIRCRRTIQTNDLYSNMTPEMEALLRDAGFLGVARLRQCHYDWHLISALVERWRPETHTFHLPDGECTITLQDVSVLTGLPIDGRPLTGRVRREYLALCQSLLGISPEPSDIRYSLVRSSWFKENFSQLPEHVDQTTLHRHTRAYILQLCSSVLFPKFDTGKVSLLFLHYLENIDLIGQYSWGSACLASLYRELCRASRLPAVAQMAGPLFLLQLWAWERFPFLAPTLRDRSIPSHAPLGHRYYTLYL